MAIEFARGQHKIDSGEHKERHFEIINLPAEFSIALNAQSERDINPEHETVEMRGEDEMIEEEASLLQIESAAQQCEQRNLHNDQTFRPLLGFDVIEFFINFKLYFPFGDFLLHERVGPRTVQRGLHAQRAIEGIDIHQRLQEKENDVGNHEERERLGKKFFAPGKVCVGERAGLKEKVLERFEKFAVEVGERVQQFFRKVPQGMIVRVEGFLATGVTKFSGERSAARNARLSRGNFFCGKFDHDC